MKSLPLTLPLFSFLVLFSCLKAQEVTRLNCLSENNLKGQVKAVTTRVYFAVDNFGKITKGRLTYHSDNNVALFDRNGNLAERRHYDIDGDMVEKWVWLYDAAGNIAELKKVFGVDLNSSFSPIKPQKSRPLDLSWRYYYLFDDKGRIRYSTTHYRERTKSGSNVLRVSDSSVYEYYPTGTLKLKKSYQSPKELINRLSTDIYDVMVSLYDSNGKNSLGFRCTEIYEDLNPRKNKGKTNARSFSAEEIVFDNSCAGDFRGKLIAYDTTSRTSYKYKSGLLVQEVWVYKDDPQIVMVTDYNDNGDLIRESVVGGSNEHVYSFTYPSYDAFGNWLSKVKFEDGVPRYLYEREIQYY